MEAFGLLYASRLRQKPNTEQYRSGHNGHDWKSCVPQKGTEGSNPSCSAMKKATCIASRFFQLNPPCGRVKSTAVDEIADAMKSASREWRGGFDFIQAQSWISSASADFTLRSKDFI